MDKISLIKEAINRFKTERPEFFNKIMKYSIYFIIIILIPLLLEWLEIISLPVKLSLFLWQIIYFLIGTSATATLPNKDPNNNKIDTND